MAALAFFATAGCNQLRAPVEPHADPYGGKQIYVDTYKLQQDIAVGRPTLTHDDAGLLHAVVPVRSVIDRPFTLQYQVHFFNRDGHEVNTLSWNDKPLTPNTPDQIEVNSSGPADDFQINLRLPPGYDR